MNFIKDYSLLFQIKSFDPKWHFLTHAFDIFFQTTAIKERILNMPLSKQAGAEKFESLLKEKHSQPKEA